MKTYHDNQQNELAKYKINHPEITWEKLATKVGVRKITLIRISQKNEEDIMNITLDTYFKLKEKIGVDLIINKKNYDKEKRENT